jgi:hypothetical protein
VPIANGGTGAVTATAALTALLPPLVSGAILTNNGTVASWGVVGTGTVTSVTGTSPITVATGTSTPAITLGTVPVANGGTGATTFTAGRLLFGAGTSAIAPASILYYDSVNNLMGIGTPSPGYPVDIEVTVNHDFNQSYGYVNSCCTGTGSNTNNSPFSLFATGRIVASEVDAISDARIKKVIGPSDIVSDLETLKKLKIVNYHYIDAVEKGNQAKKGVIAQEVEKVYPDAVRTMSNFIPSVYVMADQVRYNDATHELTVTVAKAHCFAVGDTVRIIAGEAGNLDKPVAAVIDEHTFALSGVEKAPSKVFVFGKKVDNFRVVDYDQLFSMNVGATQQLAIENETLTKENETLMAENKSLETRLAALEQAIADMRKQK